jgi:hypothetical protein
MSVRKRKVLGCSSQLERHLSDCAVAEWSTCRPLLLAVCGAAASLKFRLSATSWGGVLSVTPTNSHYWQYMGLMRTRTGARQCVRVLRGLRSPLLLKLLVPVLHQRHVGNDASVLFARRLVPPTHAPIAACVRPDLPTCLGDTACGYSMSIVSGVV